MSIWLPPKVNRGLREKTSEYAASVESMVQRFKDKMDEFNRELYKLDPRLELIFVPPNADLVGAIPGRYHVLRTAPDAPPTLIPVTGPNGEFCEPDSGIFTWLAENDMWNDRAKHDRERMRRRAEESARRQKEREREEMREELVERWKAATETSISFNRSSPWSQNVAGARGRRR